MKEIQNILLNTSHRPFTLPGREWKYYQEWNSALFLHWDVPYEFLRELVPDKLTIDSYDRKYYVSLVAFIMQNVRPKNFPSLKFISDFHEVNVRTYVNNDNKKGVYFLNIEAEKNISAFIARHLSGFPYEKSDISRNENSYVSINRKKNLKLKTVFKIGELLTEKTELDIWLTERYCAYVEKGQNIYRYNIHHNEWEIQNVNVESLDLNYNIGKINLTADTLKKQHYSKGVKVLTWTKELVN